MKKRSLFLSLLLGVVCSSVQATTLITNVTFGGVNGALYNCVYANVGTPGNILGGTMYGYQSGQGQMGLTLFTDNTEDPLFTFDIDTLNTSGFTWTSYIVDVSMSTLFSITNAAVVVPGDWSVAVTQPTLVGPNYVGQIVFSSGTPIAPGSQFRFGYGVEFAGGPTFSLNQTLTPVPEPGSLALLAGGFVLMGLRALRRSRK